MRQHAQTRMKDGLVAVRRCMRLHLVSNSMKTDHTEHKFAELDEISMNPLIETHFYDNTSSFSIS